MSTLDFYHERAAECRADADKATLENVRQRNLQAAIAWDGMAERITKTIAHREANQARRDVLEA